MGKVKLKRLKIEKYRNVAPGTELVFNDGFNVLLGRNGTGKTTLLKFAAMALSSDFADLEDEDFAIEYELTSQETNLTVAISNNLGENKDAPWHYSATVQFNELDRKYTVSVSPNEVSGIPGDNAALKVPTQILQPFTRHFLLFPLSSIFHEASKDLKKPADSGKLLLNYGQGRFDESLSGFHAMTGEHLEGSDRIDYATITLRKSMEDASLDGHLPAYVPEELWNVVRQNTSLLGQESIQFRHHDLRFLQKFVDLLEIRNASMILHLAKKDNFGTSEQFRYTDFSFVFTLNNGTVITQKALSYGQKRLLSFLYHIAVNSDIVIADELVNGMHYDWIDACLDEIGTRQAFLASQNPLLLDFLPFESASEAARSFILCELKNHTEQTSVTWANMSPKVAESFYRAYEAGVQHVSAILRTKGLW
jgi:ABC-type lipoprotein export system ATPase subunit